MSSTRNDLVDLGPQMTDVRRFVEDDIPQVADLHRRVFNTGDGSDPGWMDSYRRYFAEVFLQPAFRSDGIASLVYEESPGSVVGFLGVHERTLLFEQQPIRMALSSQFVVDPNRRGLVGLRMLKQFFAGPQDLSLADEAVDGTRRIWEWCGGTTALLYSIHWVRPLRPAEAAVALLLKPLSPRLAQLSAPVAWMVDALGRGRPFQPSVSRGSGEDLQESLILALSAELMDGRSLRPDYRDGSLSWVLQRASTRKAAGEFRKVVVRDEKQEIAGWYLYFANRGGIAEVLQIAARKNAVEEVLDHLIYDAWRSGAIALSGRLDPAFAQELSERHCLFYRRGFWTLIHSKNPKLLYAIQRGDAFLTRLEGEWCLRFR